MLGMQSARAEDSSPSPSRSNANKAPSLKEVGKRVGIAYGLSETTAQFPANRGYYEQIAKECNIYVPGNEFNWKTVERAKGVRAYGKLDTIAQFMKERDVALVGHTLLWYYAVPQWLTQMEAPSDIFNAMDAYIHDVVSRFRGNVVRWDVINEQLAADSKGDGLRRTFYLDKLGRDYMKHAFAAARAADPKVLLCYNDFGFEYDKPDNHAKRAAFLTLLRQFRDDKVELDCVGFQSHLDASLPLDRDGLVKFAREVNQLGYKIAITELDVIDENLPADENTRDRIVADHVKDYLACVGSEAKPVTVTSWGFTDNRTWLTMWHRRKDGRAMRPLPFDDQYNRKEQWASISQYLLSKQ
jgi:endo-1,4-beta-xylanase